MTLKESMQAAFEKSCKGVIEQGIRAFFRGSCVYRTGGEGPVCKCAIGQLISDEQMKKYRISDNTTVSHFPLALIEELLPGCIGSSESLARQFLHELQYAHDSSKNPGEFVVSFRDKAGRIAERYNLDSSFLLKAG